MKTRLNFSLCLMIVLLLVGCSSPSPVPLSATGPAAVPPAPATVTTTNIQLKVFAPSSLSDAAKDLSAAFESANPGVKVVFEFGHSPTQRLQFTQGAQGDVFLTASQKDMDDAITDQTVASGKAKIFAENQLVVVLSGKNTTVQKLEDLATLKPKILVAVADTPVGKVTMDVLDKMDKQFGAGFKTAVVANIVSYEAGVKPIISKIKLGEADAGIVYITDTTSAPELKTIPIPANLNMITQLNAAPLVKAANSDKATQFTAYLVSSQGQSILKKWGFLPGKP